MFTIRECSQLDNVLTRSRMSYCRQTNADFKSKNIRIDNLRIGSIPARFGLETSLGFLSHSEHSTLPKFYSNLLGFEILQHDFKKCLNVRQKLGTWKFFNVFLCFPMFSNVVQCYLLSFSLSLTISLSLSHYHSLTLSISH